MACQTFQNQRVSREPHEMKMEELKIESDHRRGNGLMAMNLLDATWGPLKKIIELM